MKRIFLVIIIFLITLLLLFKKQNTISVFKNESDDIYKYIYVYHESMNIENMELYLKDLDIISIIPYISPVYNNCISIKYKNNNNFKELFLSYIKEKGYYTEYNKYIIEPIKINKVLVYSNINNIKKYNLKYTLDNNLNCKNLL